MILSFLFLFLVGGTLGSLHRRETKESSTLTDRVEKLERLLSEQDARLSDQEKKLYQQDLELTQQRNIIHQQASALSRQERVLREQGIQLTQQKDINLQQASALSNQERVLRQQSGQLLQQGALLRQQDNLLRQQNARLSRQEDLLFQQRELIQRLRSVSPRTHPTVYKTQEEHQFFPDSLSEATNISHSETSDKTETFASHSKFSARSDDAGPLEAVVSHISQQVTEMSADITALKNSNTQQDNDIQDAQSSTFVHWGSSNCSSFSQLVYSGAVGGSWWTDTGAATNYLCLTMSPVFADRHVDLSAYLYGSEYGASVSQYNSDPVCAVCRSTFSTTVMIPGTNVCTPGWHLQYSGFLMAGRSDHAAGSEYICVDSRLEAVVHSGTNEDGKLLHVTVTRCGSLPCPPYVNDKIVTCAVCSK